MISAVDKSEITLETDVVAAIKSGWLATLFLPKYGEVSFSKLTSNSNSVNLSIGVTSRSEVSDSGSNEVSVGAAAGVAVGGVVLLGLAGALYYYYLKETKGAPVDVNSKNIESSSETGVTNKSDVMSVRVELEEVYEKNATPVSFKHHSRLV